MKKIFSCLFISFFLILVTAQFSFSQQTDYTSSVSSFKNKYPKTDIVATEIKNEYNFVINNKTGDAKVIADESTTETLLPLKDNLVNTDAIFYDQQSSIENVRAAGAKNKSIKFFQQCSDYQSDGIFYSDAKLCVIKIPMDEKGMALNYSYNKQYKDVKYLTSVYFHENFPIEKRTLIFNVPDWLEVDLREFNFAGYDIKKDIQKDPATKTTKYIYELKNIPALKKEYRSPDLAKEYPHIIVVSKSFTDNGQKKILFESVKDLYAWYHSLCKDIGNSNADLQPMVSQLTKDKKSDIEKIESMYYWVQDKVRYIAFENGIMGFKPEAAQNVFKNKYGDCKGKANLLTQMLRVAGYDARLTWIGTADLPYDYSLPSLAVDNHMISTLVLNGKHYFLDGTEEDIAFNDYASRIQGKQVLIEDGDNYMLDRIPEFPADKNKIESNLKLKISDGALTGTCNSIYNGEAKISIVGAFNAIRSDTKKDELESFLKSDNSNVVISNIHEPVWGDRQKPLQISYDIKVNNQVTKAANELYINPDWKKELASFDFDSTRKNDYEFDHKICINTQIEIAVPDGYKIDYLPENVSKKMPDYSFEGSYTNKGNSILYSKKIIINKTIIRKQEFDKWNDFAAAITKFYNDQVVLAKK
ncbi:MAG TPA: transglutaminase-like domain-containing protein [Puia sp.]|nr:transglutaminase-like domain-containing protein [Puia sp.]